MSAKKIVPTDVQEDNCPMHGSNKTAPISIDDEFKTAENSFVAAKGQGALFNESRTSSTDAVAKHVDALSSRSAAAARALCDLLRAQHCAEEAGDAGALPLLVSLLGEGGAACADAATALSLICKTDKHKQAVQKMSIAAPLVRVVQSGDEPQRAAVFELLRRLCSGAAGGLKDALIAANIAPPLIHMLKDAHVAEQERALRAIDSIAGGQGLAGPSPQRRQELGFALVPALVDAANGGSSKVALIFDTLRHFTASNAPEIESLGVVEFLVKALEGGSDLTADEALSQLATAYSSCVKATVEAGAVPLLVAYMKDPSNEGHADAAKVLANIASFRDGVYGTMLVDAGAVPVLKELKDKSKFTFERYESKRALDSLSGSGSPMKKSPSCAIM